jgi:hypothetical protein
MWNEEHKIDSTEKRKNNIHENGEEELEHKITITFIE